tara:strand:- start:8835 stop:9401 length:567 start_codon:yes stop_codon:yes gene_type:complete
MATLNEIVANKTIQYFDSVAINIDATHNYYLTQAPYNLDIGGQSYQAAGGLLQMSDFVDNANFSIEKLEIQLAGIVDLPGTSQSVLKTIQELEYIDKPVTIYRSFMEEFKVAHTITLYQGYIANISAALAEQGESTTAAIETASHWTDFDRVSTRYTNQNSQQDIHPTDSGFSFAKEVQKEVQWKEAG